MNDFEIIGANARRIRKLRGLTQGQVCERAPGTLQVSDVSTMENGNPISMGVLRKVAGALGVRLHELTMPPLGDA